ncbi:MAG TPA: diadenylate cyclase CdaA [Clostridiaceae bacterium]|nr:diadenylate cyclase CdaA [Clostridiaceae bacterium]
MIENFMTTINEFFQINIIGYINELYQYPIKLISLILDLTIVIFLGAKFIKSIKSSRVGQLLKGIVLFVLMVAVSDLLNLKILNFILTSVMTYGVIALIIIFQPELRRALEQLGTNKFTRFFGIDKDIMAKTKEDIYKVVIAALELSKTKTGGLIVLEREIKIKDIIDTGVILNSEVSPQLLVNLFTPNTPLHDGAVIISDNKIVAAACILPLAGDNDISKELGTRHRAALGISKESDSIAIVVSEETGKISIAKNGTLIVDVKEEALKRILIKSMVTDRYKENEITKTKINNVKNTWNKIHFKKDKSEKDQENNKQKDNIEEK